MRGKSRSGSEEPIEFKGTSLSVVNVLVRTADLGELSAALEKRLGQMPDFFSGETAIVDLSPMSPPPAQVDWPALVALLRRYQLAPVAARAAGDCGLAAQAAGLALLEETGAAARPAMETAQPPAKPTSAAAVEQAELWPAESEAASAAGAASPAPARSEPAPPAPLPASAAVPTLVVDKPLRSGQQIYARGGDLVVLAMVSAGAEVIADGSIHIYAPLRGRALAGARGDQDARIFATRFEAELVSVAGVYRTFERGIAAEVAGKPAQVRLTVQGEKQSLSVEPLNIG